MKRIFSLVTLVLLAATFVMAQNTQSTHVAILYFENTGDPALEKLKTGLADMLITDMSTCKSLSIVERARLDEILKEQKLNNSKSFDASTATRLGKLLGARIILTGSFFEMMGTLRIDARVIEVETGKILKSDGVDGPTTGFFSLEKELAKKLLTDLDAKLSDDERSSLDKSAKEQAITYEASLIYSGALQAESEGDKVTASQKLNVVLAENPSFEPAKHELEKIGTVNVDSITESRMRGSGDPLKGLNVTKAAPVIGQGKYYALIIGIDKYSGTWPALKTAVNDAKAVETILGAKYKFDKFITLYNEQATRANIFDRFEWLVENISENDNVFIYFSGHGDFKPALNKGYWIPSDATTSATSAYVSNNDIQTFLGAIKSKHTLMVSDACFSGDIFRGNTVSVAFEQSEKYYKQVNGLVSRKAMSSGGVEPVMDGGKEGHSVFAYYFLKTIETNKEKYMDGSQVFNSIKVPVTNNSEQTPMFQPVKNTGDEGGQFIFILK